MSLTFSWNETYLKVIRGNYPGEIFKPRLVRKLKRGRRVANLGNLERKKNFLMNYPP